MVDKTPIPGSRLEGVFSKKKKADSSGDMSRDLQTHESQSRDPQSHDTDLTTHESNTHDSGNIIHDSGLMKQDSRTASIDTKILEWAITKGRGDPRISGYSEFAMSVLRYLRRTTPEFSMSGAASDLLEEALEEKYPELSKKIREEMKKVG